MNASEALEYERHSVRERARVGETILETIVGGRREDGHALFLRARIIDGGPAERRGQESFQAPHKDTLPSPLIRPFTPPVMDHDDDAEKLDWGNEDDEQAMGIDPTLRTAGDDAEDAVSIGGDVDDMQEFYAYQSRTQQQESAEPAPADAEQRRPPDEPQPVAPRAKGRRDKTPERPARKDTSRRGNPPQMKHALPPKPSVPPPPPKPQRVAPPKPPAQAIDYRPEHERRRPPPNDPDVLPPPWESRQSRTGPEIYYYNPQTHENTWVRPTWDNVSDDDRHPRPIGRREPSISPPRPRTENGAPANTSSRAAPPTQRRVDAEYTTGRNDPDRYYRPGDASGSNGLDGTRLRSLTRSASPHYRVQPVMPRDERTTHRNWESPSVEPRAVAPPHEERRWVPRGQDPASSPVEPRRERPVSPVAVRHAPTRDHRIPPYEQDSNGHESVGTHWSAPNTSTLCLSCRLPISRLRLRAHAPPGVDEKMGASRHISSCLGSRARAPSGFFMLDQRMILDRSCSPASCFLLPSPLPAEQRPYVPPSLFVSYRTRNWP